MGPNYIQQTPLWVTLLVGVVGGLAAAVVSPFISSFIDNKSSKSKKAQSLMDSLSNKVSQVVSPGGLEHNNPRFDEAHFYKSTNQLEALGYTVLATQLREFLELWKELELPFGYREKEKALKMKGRGKKEERLRELAYAITKARA